MPNDIGQMTVGRWLIKWHNAKWHWTNDSWSITYQMTKCQMTAGQWLIKWHNTNWHLVNYFSVDIFSKTSYQMVCWNVPKLNPKIFTVNSHVCAVDNINSEQLGVDRPILSHFRLKQIYVGKLTSSSPRVCFFFSAYCSASLEFCYHCAPSSPQAPLCGSFSLLVVQRKRLQQIALIRNFGKIWAN